MAAAALLEDLRRRLSEAEGGFGDATRRRHVSTGIAPLDAALPGGGLPAGALTEILEEREGGFTLAALASREAARAGGRIAWIDFVEGESGELDPPALAAWGIDLRRLLVIRPRSAREALWAFEQTIRSRAVAASVAALRGVSNPLTRRLQLAAEEGEGLALLVRPAREAAIPSAAAVRLGVAPAPSSDPAVASNPGPEGASRGAWLPPRRIAVELLRARGALAQARMFAEVVDALGVVRGAAASLDRSGVAGRRAASA